MKNKLLTISLVVFAVMLISIGLGTVAAISTGGIKKMTIDEIKTIGIENASEITIDVDNAKVNLRTTTGDTISSHLYGSTTFKNREYIVEKVGNTIRISSTKRSFITLWSFGNLTLDIDVPESYTGNLILKNRAGSTDVNLPKLSDVDINSSAGKITMSDIVATKFTLKSSAGSIETKNVTCSGDVYMKSSAGKIVTKTIVGNNVEINSSAGEIYIEGLQATNATTRNSAGSTMIKNIKNTNLISTNSAGKLAVEYVEFNNNNVDISSSAGSVELTLPKTATFNLQSSTTAGRVNCQFPVTTTNTSSSKLYGNVGVEVASNTVKIKSSAGNVDIYKNN